MKHVKHTRMAASGSSERNEWNTETSRNKQINGKQNKIMPTLPESLQYEFLTASGNTLSLENQINNT